jgi:predicted Zn-dependent peptidase
MQTVKLDDRLYRTDAENGVTVLSEVLPGVRSVAIGIWVKTASVHEEVGKMGLSHLLEHMVFKGTERRSARDIALELEVRGGALDAYTSREHTSYQARVLDEDLPRALDVLTDLVRNPVLRADDLELERKVVLEEISTVEDTPDDLVFELHSRTLWPEHPYGYSILGTRDTISQLSATDLRALHGRAYHPRHVVITAAGNLNHDLLLKLVAKCGWFTYEAGPEPPTVTPVPPGQRTTKRVHRDSVQTHIVAGTDEELGLAYAVSTYQSFYHEAGLTGVYVGTHPSTAEQAVDVILDELKTLATEGLSGSVLAEAKQQLKGQVTLSLESPTARMYRLATVELYGEPYRTIDQVMAGIDRIGAEQVGAVAAEFFDPARQTTVWLGPN